MIVLRSIFVLLALLPLILGVWIVSQVPSSQELLQISRSVHFLVKKTPAKGLKLVGVEGGLNTRTDNIPKQLLDALVASEDHRFYDRGSLYMVAKFTQAGVSCVRRKIRTRRAQCGGNSTITQQLAKLLMVPQKQRTARRKFIELLWAIKMEAVLSKEEILKMYANRVYLGSGYYGVGMAARGYFHNDLSRINLIESALLAGAVQKPVRNPKLLPKQNRARAQVILDLMFKNQFLTKRVKIPSGYRGRKGYRLPPKRFDKYLWYWVQPKISRHLSAAQPGVYKVWTTLDPEFQIYSERRLNQAVKRLPNVSQGAVVVMRADGQVLAMVGGVGDDIVARGRNRAIETDGLYCPAAASTMKIVVYTAAFENGLQPNTLIDASPYQHIDPNGRVYRPRNFDGRVYSEVEVREAFKRSHNTASVRLLDQFGFEKFRSTAHRYGLPMDNVRNELGIALGQNQVCPLDMTVAYATIANEGHRPKGAGIIGIVNEVGKVVYKTSILDKLKLPWSRDFGLQASRYMNELLLLSVGEGGTGTRAAHNLPKLAIAGKTGTIDDFTGAWFIGYVEPKDGFSEVSNRLVIGVWIGNDIPKKSPGLYGGTAPARVFNELVRDISEYTKYFEQG